MRVGVLVGSRFNRVPERQPFGDSSRAKVRMRGNGQESGVAAEGGEESGGRVKRRRKGELQPGDGGQPQATGKKRRQPKKGVVLGEDGQHAGSGAGREGEADSASSQP